MLAVGVVIIVASLIVGRSAGAIAGVGLSAVSTLRYLSIRGKGVDPSKSAIQRYRDGERTKYGRPF